MIQTSESTSPILYFEVNIEVHRSIQVFVQSQILSLSSQKLDPRLYGLSLRVPTLLRKNLDDFNDVIKRSLAAGVKSVIITGGSLHESREALKFAKNLGIVLRVPVSNGS